MRRSAALAGILLCLLGLAPQARGADGTRGKMAGVMMVTPQSGERLNPAEAQRIRAAGANTAGITVYWETTDDQNGVRREAASIDDVPLRASIQTARGQGLEVALHLMLHCRSCQSGWRGDIDPSDTEAFFNSYRSMVNEYAVISQQEGVKRLFIGSEMTTLQSHDDEWRRVASDARERFSGLIVYEANWDNIRGVDFWDAVDEVGVSAYFPLTDRARPTVAEIKAGWREGRNGGDSWFERMKSVAQETHKRVVFGEVGYRSTDRAGYHPWEAFTDDPYNAQTQANLYQALLETFEPEPWWVGVTWWEWLAPVSDSDRTFTPRDKSAEKLLHLWWAVGTRPSAKTTYPDGSLILDPPAPAPPPVARARSTTARPSSTGPAPTEAPTTAPVVADTVPDTAPRDVAAPLLGREKVSTDAPGGVGTIVVALVFLAPVTLGAFALLRFVRFRAKPVWLLPPEA